MKQKFFTTAFGLLITISAFAYSGGNGTENNPYLISSKADMEQLATNVNGGQTYSGVYFKLTRDLMEASDTVTTVIGNSDSHYFSGIFDGDEHEIAINQTGIFGNIQNAVIQNLGVSGRISTYSTTTYSSYLYSHYYGGGICGNAISSKIINCRNSARIESNYSDLSSHYYCGGICGLATSSKIINCRNSARVESNVSYMASYSSQSYVSGICGYVVSNDTISNCYNTGLVSGTVCNTYLSPYLSYIPYSFSGGICGYIESSGNYISNCYNTGNITAKSLIQNLGLENSWAGGICGYSNNTSKINTCYNTGDISSYYYAGGISGYGGQIQDCFVADCRMNNITDMQVGARTGRICGSGGAYNNCYADINTVLNGLPVSSNDVNSKGGKDEVIDSLQSQLWLSSTLSWDFTVWKTITGEFPRFIGPPSIHLALSETAYGSQVTLNAVSDNNAVPIAYESSNNDIVEIVGDLLIAKKIGTVTITASQEASEGFWAGSASFSFTVQKKEVIVTANPASIIYGEDIPLSYSGLYSGFNGDDNEDVLTSRPTFTCSATAQSNAGKYAIIPAGAEAENYSFVYVTDFLTIQKHNLHVTPVDTFRTYGSANPTFNLLYDGFINGNTVADISEKPIGVTTATASSNVGEYTITCSGGNATNYSFIYGTGKLTVTKAPLTATSNVERKYGANNSTISITYSGFKNSDSEISLTAQPQVTCTATAASNIGSYPIIVSGGEATNYDISCMDGILTVAKAPLTVVAQSATSVYGDPLPDYTCQYIGFVNDESENVLTKLPSLTCDATALSDAGSYSIVPSNAEAANYEFSYIQGTLTINKVPLTVTAQPASSVYGDALLVYSCTYSGFVNDESESVLTKLPSLTCDATALSDAGEYSIIPSNAEAQNYTFSYQPSTLTIQKRNLQVTPDNVSRAYGDTNPLFTLSYSGFVNGNTASNIGTNPTVTTPATQYSNVDEYTISCSGGSSINYSFTYGTGTLTVTKAPLTITVNDAVRNEGEDNPTFTLSYSGFKNSETESVLDALPTISCDADKDSPAGFYDIVLSGGYDNNYDYQLVNGRLEVTLPNGMEGVSASKVSVYPNPVKHDLYIQSDYPIEKVEIYDQTGARVLVDKAYSGKTDVSRLSAGIYYVRVYVVNGAPENKKIIVWK